MIALLAVVALAADGDTLGPVTLGEALPSSGFECREQTCQGRASAHGVQGTLAVQRCGTVATSAVLSASYVVDSPHAASFFGPYMHLVDDARAAALAAAEAAKADHLGSDWLVHEERTEDGLVWLRVIQPPHAHLIRVAHRQVEGHDVWTASITAAATSVECP